VLNAQLYDFCIECYGVAKTLEIVVKIMGENRRVKLEALEVLHGHQKGQFEIRAYIEEDITVQRTYPQSGEKLDRKPESVKVWILYH
jgi:hypothetical protein